jgi:ribosomal protein L28
MINKTIFQLSILIIFSITIGHCQSIKKSPNREAFLPNLQDENFWELKNNTKAIKIKEFNKNGIKLTSTNALMVLKNYKFEEGTIEFDVKGRDLFQQSFPGIAFHIQNDSTYDVVYFRPFNFAPADTSRRYRAVQYMSVPKFEWPYLRANFPLKYENKVNPIPKADEWFHAKIVIDGRKIKVYVNNSTVASLEVEKLTDTRSGNLGLWDSGGEHDSDASFANLVLTPKKK